jgi:KaiC/GvpD/RAD55 family RecA-like ATPase
MNSENIFRGLLSQPNYYRKVIAHLQPDFFDENEQIIFKKIKAYSDEYNKQPTGADIRLLIENDMSLTEGETDQALNYIKKIQKMDHVDDDLLFNETEKFAQDMAFENVLKKAVDIVMDENSEKNITKGSLPDLFRDALSISFSISLGHDYFRDAIDRYEFYTNEEELIAFDVDALNKAFNNGLRRKSISCLLGRTNIGKTLWLCHIATDLTRSGYNVLYVSGEMDENLIAQRIDANFLDMAMDNFNLELDRKSYLKKIRNVYEKVSGKLKIKEYSAGACNALHLKNLLQEYKLKDGFEPDVIILDYINLFSSFRLPAAALSNSYLYVKSVAEEMRGLAREFNCACLTATQTNRGGSESGNETDMSDTADSYGLPMTVDGLYAIIQNEELFKIGKYLLKVLKTRYGDNINEIYTLGVDRSHMRLQDLPEDQQELPQHLKDELNWQAQKAREKKDREATEDIGMKFD